MCAIVTRFKLELRDGARHYICQIFGEPGHHMLVTVNGLFTDSHFWDEPGAFIDVRKELGQGYKGNPFLLINETDFNLTNGRNILTWLYPYNESPYLLGVEEIESELHTRLHEYFSERQQEIQPLQMSSFWMQHIVYLLMCATARYVARNVFGLAERVDLYKTILDPLEPWDILCFYSLHMYVTVELLETVQGILHGDTNVSLVFDNPVEPTLNEAEQWQITDDTKPPDTRSIGIIFYEDTSDGRLLFIKTEFEDQERYLFNPHRGWFKAVPKELVRCLVSIFSRWMNYQYPRPTLGMIRVGAHDGLNAWEQYNGDPIQTHFMGVQDSQDDDGTDSAASDHNEPVSDEQFSRLVPPGQPSLSDDDDETSDDDDDGSETGSETSRDEIPGSVDEQPWDAQEHTVAVVVDSEV